MELAFLAWTEDYAVGHKGLDAEHRHLVEAINEIHAAEYAGQTSRQLRPLLSALELAAVAHFKHENSVMREISDAANQSHSQVDLSALLQAVIDADVSEHLAEHARALLTLEAIIHAYCSGAEGTEPTLGRDLKDWFVEHATKYDAHLKVVFLAMLE